MKRRREPVSLTNLQDAVSLNLFYGILRGRRPSSEDVGRGRANARQVAWTLGRAGSVQVAENIRNSVLLRVHQNMER